MGTCIQDASSRASISWRRCRGDGGESVRNHYILVLGNQFLCGLGGCISLPSSDVKLKRSASFVDEYLSLDLIFGCQSLSRALHVALMALWTAYILGLRPLSLRCSSHALGAIYSWLDVTGWFSSEILPIFPLNDGTMCYSHPRGARSGW